MNEADPVASLTELYDDFCDFTEQLAFFVDALPGLCEEGDGPDPASWSGMRRFGQRLKADAQSLCSRLRKIEESKR